MGQAQVEKSSYTISEWLALEVSTGERYEYHFGTLYLMAGGSIKHVTISGNAFRLIENHFDDNDINCQAFISDLKIEISKEGRYVYPDTVAVCKEISESDTIAGAITNPVLVIEVASKSTEGYDRTKKYEYYTGLPSVRQYAIVSQTSPFVTIYSRNKITGVFDEGPAEVRGLENNVDLLCSIGMLLPMSKLYRNISFDKTISHLHPVKK